MWEEHPNVFREVGDVTITGTESFQLPAFPCNGIDPMTRDVAATTDGEIYQIATCISNGNECLVSDACAGTEVNICDYGRVDIMIVEKINNVLVPQLVLLIATQSQSTQSTQCTPEVQQCSILLDDVPFDIGSDTTKFVSHRM